MSDRALFAAFQKVKAQVDDAVSLTREREARARAEEEKARAAKKTRVVKAAETRRAEAGTASISASAFSATGGFGAALADAAKSSGASFRMAAPAKSRGGQPVTAPKAEPSAVRKHAQMSPSTKAKEAQGKRHDAKADRAGRPVSRQASGTSVPKAPQGKAGARIRARELIVRRRCPPRPRSAVFPMKSAAIPSRPLRSCRGFPFPSVARRLRRPSARTGL